MKKLIALAICLLLLLPFGGCAKKSEPVNMNRLYSVDANVKVGNFTADIGLNRLGNGVWDINFTKPDNLNGLSISYENDKANITYKGLSFALAKEDIPVKAIMSNLTNVLDNAALGKDISFTKKDGKITAKGKVNGIDYSITLDEKTGTILQLALPKQDLEVSFKDYKLMT